MKKTLLSLAGIALVLGAHAQAPQFRQIKRVNVSSFFTGDTVIGNQGAHGSFIGGLTADGDGNVYASGWSSASGTNNAGVVKISNILGAESVSSFNKRAGVAGGSRQTKIQWANNSLYWGYGMGNTGASDNGIRRLDGSGATLFDVNGGTITGTASRRFDTFHVGPNGLVAASLTFDSNWNTPAKVYNVNSSTGAFTSGLSFANATPGGSSAFRDMWIANDGTIYTKRATFTNGIQSWTVSGSTINGPGAQFSIPGTATTNAEEKLGFGEAFNNGSVAYQSFLLSSIQVGSATSPRSNVQVIAASGSGFSTFNLTGSEDGLPTFGSNAAGLGTTNQTCLTPVMVTMNGKQYLLVGESTLAGSGVGDWVRVYEAVPEPTTMAALGLGVAAMLRRRNKKS